MTALPLAGFRLGRPPADAAARHAGELLSALGAEPTTSTASVDRVALTVAPAPDSGPVADWAASGAMDLTGPPDGPPLVAPGRPATAARGALLAIDALAGAPTGIAGHRLLGERAALAGLHRSAPWSVGGSCRAVRTADGWVAMSLARADDVACLPALMEAEVDGQPWEAVDEWAGRRTGEEVALRGQLLGLAVAPVPPAPVPLWPPWTVTSSGRVRSADAALGPVVLDLSALWAGPSCAHLLGLTGAQVIRVESTERPDGGRRGIAAFDDLLHAGQPSVALPFATADGRARLHDLVARADVVITSARPRALAQLGLDPNSYLTSRTDAVWVAITAHPPGPDGQAWIGYGDDAAMSGGLHCWVDGVPVPSGDAIADPLTGAHAAVAALAALRAGGRHLIAVNLAQVAASVLDDGLLPTAELGPHGWQVLGEHGSVPVVAPSARLPAGRARELGADTDQVLGRLHR
jgi:hypothetical protein